MTRVQRAATAVKVRSAPPRQPLKFGNGNAKLDQAIFTFSLPAGYFCPFAKECLSRANRATGHIADGPWTRYRCYAASGEARATSVREFRWHNAALLRSCRDKGEMVALILDSLSPFAGYVRLHESGDFFSQAYFDAWLEVARWRPRTLFYGYTKSLTFLVRRLGQLPVNFVMTASFGGRDDDLIEEYGLRYARVVFSEDEAAVLGLPLDHDDSHAMDPDCKAFALLLHGTQPKGTAAAEAMRALRAQGEFGYGDRADEIRRERGRLPLRLAH